MRYALELFTTSTVKKTISKNTAAIVHGGERGDLSQKPGFLDSGSTFFVISCSLASILALRPWKSADVPRASTRENSVVQYIMPYKDGMLSSPKHATNFHVDARYRSPNVPSWPVIVVRTTTNYVHFGHRDVGIFYTRGFFNH